MDTAKPLLSWKIQIREWGRTKLRIKFKLRPAKNSFRAACGTCGTAAGWNLITQLRAPLRRTRVRTEQRYFWRVIVWDENGKAYPASDPSWWETGLLQQENWKAKWIGYEETEEQAVRESGAAWITNAKVDAPKDGKKANHDFRFHFELTKPVRHAALYVTGQDSPAAWINGKQILQSEPPPAWEQFPWKGYKVRDVSSALQPGRNTLAIEIVRYGGPPVPTQTPMSAVLYVEFADGAAQTFTSDPQGWRATLNATGNWQTSEFDDAQ